MRKAIFFLLTAFILSSIVSCKKDDSSTSSTSPLTGNWKLISISAQTQSTIQYTDAGSVFKTVTNSAYTSTNNGGTVTFSPSAITATGVTYQISDTAYGYDYMDNQLEDSLSFPFAFTCPPTNSTSSYKMIGQDSIYFAGQTLITTQGSTGSSSPSGAKFNITGNTLTLTSNLLKDTVINYAGTPMSQHETGVASLILQKQ